MTCNQINQCIFFSQLQQVEIHVEAAVTHPRVNLTLLVAEKLYISVKLLSNGETLQMDQLTKASHLLYCFKIRMLVIHLSGLPNFCDALLHAFCSD